MNGDEILAGDPITEGSINPHDILRRIQGVRGVQDYVLKEDSESIPFTGC